MWWMYGKTVLANESKREAVLGLVVHGLAK
jgi:hypothetical protein